MEGGLTLDGDGMQRRSSPARRCGISMLWATRRQALSDPPAAVLDKDADNDSMMTTTTIRMTVTSIDNEHGDSLGA